MDDAKNCWEYKNSGRKIGGSKVKELGVCVAIPHHGKDCWQVAGTFFGGKVQGMEAQKCGTCMACDWCKTVKK
jgi:hypothetical protein